MTLSLRRDGRPAITGMLVAGSGLGLAAAIGVVLAGPLIGIALVAGLLAVIGLVYRPGVLFAAYLLIPYYKAALQPFSPVDLTVLLALLNALQVLPLIVDRHPRDISRASVFLWGAMALLILGGALYAPRQDLAFSHAATYWALVLLPILPAALRVGSDPRHLRDLLWAFFAMGVVTVVLGLANLPSGDRVTALGMNTIQTARAALLVPLLGVAFVLRERAPFMRLVTIVLIPPAIIVALASGSRGPLLVLVAMAAFGVIRAFVRPRAVNWRSVGVIAAVAIASIVVLSIAAPGLPSASIGRFGDFADFVEGASSGDTVGAVGDTSSQTRVRLFDLAWSLFESHPLLGVGTGGFEALSPTLLGPAYGLAYPHNAILQLAAELGLVGVAVFAGLVFLAVTRSIPRASYLYAIRVLFLFFLLNSMVSGDIFSDRETWGLLMLVLLADPRRVADARPSMATDPPSPAWAAAPRPRTLVADLPGAARPPEPAAFRALEPAAGRRPAAPARSPQRK
jgi:O-antigen ligase